MLRSMPPRVYMGWQRYYMEEPWGAWRDNMHAALIARELRLYRNSKSRSDATKTVALQEFMLQAPEVKSEPQETSKAVSAFALMAGKAMTAEESAMVRKTARDRRRRKS